MKTPRMLTFRGHLIAIAVLAFISSIPGGTSAATLYESGTLGLTGLSQGSVAATNVNQFVFTGVRFQLVQPAVTTQIGGHFVSATGGTFFGAIVDLDGPNDFPDSGDLSTPDVLGAAQLSFPITSAEVYGDLDLSVDAGWYALVFGSGLFGANGDGAAPRNNPDIGNPSYIGWQTGTGWFDLSDLSDVVNFVDHRFVVRGNIVPEPMGTPLGMLLIYAVFIRHRSSTKS